MRLPDAQVLSAGLFHERRFAAHRITQDAVNQSAISAGRELDGFINGRVFRRREQKQLIETEPQQIAGIVIKMSGAKLTDPKIEQRQVTQDAVEKFRGKGAIRRREINGSQARGKNGVREFPSVAPFLEGGESDSA